MADQWNGPFCTVEKIPDGRIRMRISGRVVGAATETVEMPDEIARIIRDELNRIFPPAISVAIDDVEGYVITAAICEEHKNHVESVLGRQQWEECRIDSVLSIPPGHKRWLARYDGGRLSSVSKGDPFNGPERFTVMNTGAVLIHLNAADRDDAHSRAETLWLKAVEHGLWHSPQTTDAE